MIRNVEVMPYVTNRNAFADKTAEIGVAWASIKKKRQKTSRRNPTPFENSVEDVETAPCYDPNEQLVTQLELRQLRLNAQRRNGFLNQRRYEFLSQGTQRQLEKLKGGI